MSNFNLIIDNIPKGYIKPSNIHGNGLFAKKTIKAGEVLGYLDGQEMPWNHYDEIMASFPIAKDKREALFGEWNCLSEKTLLVRPFRTKYSFINHSRTPNLKLEYNPLRVTSMIDISEDTEFTLDYRKEPLRKEYLEGHGKTYL